MKNFFPRSTELFPEQRDARYSPTYDDEILGLEGMRDLSLNETGWWEVAPLRYFPEPTHVDYRLETALETIEETKALSLSSHVYEIFDYRKEITAFFSYPNQYFTRMSKEALEADLVAIKKGFQRLNLDWDNPLSAHEQLKEALRSHLEELENFRSLCELPSEEEAMSWIVGGPCKLSLPETFPIELWIFYTPDGEYFEVHERLQLSEEEQLKEWVNFKQERAVWEQKGLAATPKNLANHLNLFSFNALKRLHYAVKRFDSFEVQKRVRDRKEELNHD